MQALHGYALQTKLQDVLVTQRYRGCAARHAQATLAAIRMQAALASCGAQPRETCRAAMRHLCAKRPERSAQVVLNNDLLEFNVGILDHEHSSEGLFLVDTCPSVDHDQKVEGSG